MGECTNFYKASLQKQEDIVNAGFQVFGKNGYQNASMNEIARMAGISKPALFYYFGTKKDFFLFLYRFAYQKINEQVCEGGEDFFECLWLAIDIKLKVIHAYPGFHLFLLSVLREENFPILREIQVDSYNQFKTATSVLFKNVNWDKFRPGIDRNDVYHLISYISNGMIRDHPNDPPEIIMQQLKPLLMLLKPAFYREEYL